MKFGSQVRCFTCEGINMVGNLSNGIVIGVEEDSYQICKALASGDVGDGLMVGLDQVLVDHLEKGGFFKEEEASHGLDTAYLHITDRCNLDCESCYSYKHNRNGHEDLCTKDMLRIIESLGEASPRNLVISGGEPFLRDDLSALMEGVRDFCPGCRVTILTNGIGLDEDAVMAVSPFVNCIAVSVDGYDGRCVPYIRKRSVFNEVKRAVALIRGAKIDAHIIPTIHAKNAGDLQKYMELSKSWGVTMNFSILSCPDESSLKKGLGLTDCSLIHIANQMLELGNLGMDTINLGLGVRGVCSAGKGIVSVAADGVVYPCHMLHNRRFAMGSALLDSVQKIVMSEKGRYWRDLTIDQIDECAECQYAYLCGGGCRSRAYSANEESLGKDPYCVLMKHYYSVLLQSLKKTLAANVMERRR